MPRVTESPTGFHLLATRPYACGEQILCIGDRVRESRQPDRYSVQVGVNLHVVPSSSKTTDPGEAWRYLNHCCDANAKWVGRALVARRAIAEGDEFTFNYLTTEWEMSEAFICRCGCGGRRIGGYRHATPEERASVEADVAAHIRTLSATHGIGAPAHAAASSHLR